jgi:hypothetical protein
MKIGFDIDGVLAAFIPAYQRLVIEHAGGLNLFHPGDDKLPPCWNWPEYRGYNKDVIGSVWAHIKSSSSFWQYLGETPGCSTLRTVILDLQRNHDVYFITNRMGCQAKRQTEHWLIHHLGIERPTVLLTADKGITAKALGLDCYIDDYLENARAVCAHSPSTRTYLLDMPYNQEDAPGNKRHDWPYNFIRVKTVGQFLDAELHRL